MGAVFAVEMPAVEARERLADFVVEVVRGLPHVRQRENALFYVRGLIEQGGRKSLQPTLFRLGESGARYESLQQFLADSPWDPQALVRACVERVGSELEVEAWRGRGAAEAGEDPGLNLVQDEAAARRRALRASGSLEAPRRAGARRPGLRRRHELPHTSPP